MMTSALFVLFFSGNLLMMTSTVFLVGPTQQCKNMWTGLSLSRSHFPRTFPASLALPPSNQVPPSPPPLSTDLPFGGEVATRDGWPCLRVYCYRHTQTWFFIAFAFFFIAIGKKPSRLTARLLNGGLQRGYNDIFCSHAFSVGAQNKEHVKGLTSFVALPLGLHVLISRDVYTQAR